MVFGRRFRLADFSIEYGISSCYFGYFSFFQYSYYRKERILDIDIFYFEAIIVLDKTVLFRTIIAVFLWKGCENIDEKCVRYADVGSLYDEAV